PSAISRVQYKVLLAEEPNGKPGVSEILKTGRFPKKAGRKKSASLGEVEPITVNGLAHSQRLRSSKEKSPLEKPIYASTKAVPPVEKPDPATIFPPCSTNPLAPKA